jgi:hypothetical protein
VLDPLVERPDVIGADLTEVADGILARRPVDKGGKAISGQGRVDLERMRAVYEHEWAAVARAASEQRTRMVRAQASIDRDCHMVGRVGRFRLESDEPADRGGTDTAPTPLQYLLFGVAT